MEPLEQNVQNNERLTKSLGDVFFSSSRAPLIPSISLNPSDIGSSLKRELHFRMRMIRLYKDGEYKKIMMKFLPLDEVDLVEKKVIHNTKGTQKPPFKALIQKCDKLVDELRHSVIYISIYGRTKVGKSTMANALLGENVFPIKRNPATSCACICVSGKKVDEPTAHATISREISSDEDIASIFKQCHIDDPELEELLRKVRANPNVPLSCIDRLIGMPSELRQNPILEKIEMKMPIFGIEDSGVGLIDCPGTKENDLLSLHALQAAQKASVVIYMIKTETSLNNSDSDVKYVKTLIELGKDVIFVLNSDSRDSPEDIKEKQQSFRTIFGDQQLFVINLLNHFNQPEFTKLKIELCQRLQQRSKGLIANFLNSFEMLLRAQHLFITRVISLHLNHGANQIFKPDHNKNSKDDLYRKSTELRNSIMTLHKSAEKKLDEDKRELKAWLSKQISNFAAYVKENDIFSIDLGEKFTIPEQTSIFSFRGAQKAPSPFDVAFKKRLQRAYADYMGARLIDFVTKKKIEFGYWFLEKSQQIQTESQAVKLNLSRGIWNQQMQEFFGSMEVDIGERYNKNMKVAVPGMIGIAGATGASVFGGIFLAGIISTTFAMGGGLIFSILAIGGFGGVISATQNMFNKQPTEEEYRNTLLNNYIYQLDQQIKSYKFDITIEEILGNWLTVIEETKESLILNLLEIDTLALLDSIPIDFVYEKLCAYLKLREDLTTFVGNLKEEANTFEWQLKFMTIKDKMLASANNSLCVTCQTKIERCEHLCSRCDLILADKCPFCTHPDWIMLQFKRPSDEHLQSLINGSLDNVGRDLSSEFSKTISILEKDINGFSEFLQKYVNYGLNKYQTGKYSQADTVGFLNDINCLVNTIINHFTPPVGGLPYDIKRTLIRILHEHIFNDPVHNIFNTYYKEKYKVEDMEFVELCKRTLPFPNTLINENHKGWEEAIEHLKTMYVCKTPFEKLMCVDNMLKAMIKTQSPKTMGGDEYADAITHVLNLSQYPYMISDTQYMMDTLGNFVEGNSIYQDIYLLYLVHGLASQFKQITDNFLIQTDDEVPMNTM